MLDEKNIEKIFVALDRQILAAGGGRISLVVCGGTALTELGLVSRTTKDVDVLGALEKGQIRKIGRFPDWLCEAAAKVTADFDLPADWLNLGPESQLDTGLPEGLTRRLEKRIYGRRLTVCFISRIDQISFQAVRLAGPRGVSCPGSLQTETLGIRAPRSRPLGADSGCLGRFQGAPGLLSGATRV